jgi:hypothetical protein
MILCKDCRFWEPLSDKPPLSGLCRRRAPVRIESDIRPSPEDEPEAGSEYAIWPKTDGSCDWCGEAERYEASE